MQHLDSEAFEIQIYGDGELAHELNLYARELNVKSVKFFGRVDQAWLKMASFDALVVPSIREPLGNVILEPRFTESQSSPAVLMG